MKNKSRKSKAGTTYQTRDEFFKGSEHFRKEGYQNKGFYRRVVQVDSNSDDEIAVVKLLGKGKKKARALKGYKQGNSMYKPYIETRNHKDEPIKEGAYFKRNKSQHNVSKRDVNQMKIDALKKAIRKLREENKSKLRRLKKRN